MGNRRVRARAKGPGAPSRARPRGVRPPARGARPWWVALGLVAAGVIYAAADQNAGLVPWHRLEVEVAEADARVLAARARNARLSAEIRDLQDQPDALEAAIREEIGWVRPGEFRVDVEQADPLPPRVTGP